MWDTNGILMGYTCGKSLDQSYKKWDILGQSLGYIFEDAEQTWFPKVQNMLFSLLFSMNR